LEIDSTEGAIKSVENTINQLKGKIVKMDRVGRKRLAYEIGKFKDGFIATIWFELPTDAVAEFKKICQINENILRLTLLRLDNLEFAVPGTTSTVTNVPPAPGERGPRDHHRGDRDFRGPRNFNRDHQHQGGGDRPGGDRQDRGDRPPQGDRDPRPATTGNQA
jgi:small subunit ribosomal protein S6